VAAALRSLSDRGISATSIAAIDEDTARARKAAGLPATRRNVARAPTLLDVSIDLETSRVESAGDRLQLWNAEHMTEVEAPERRHTMVAPYGPGAVGYPSRTWRADTEGRSLVVIDASGERHVADLGDHYHASRAMDQQATRLVVLQSTQEDGGFAIAFSSDSGVKWRVAKSHTPYPLTRTSQDLATGAFDVITQSEGHTFLHRFDKLEAATVPPGIEIPKVEPRSVCRDQGILWLEAERDTRLVRVDFPSAGVVKIDATASSIEDCRAGRALFRRDGQEPAQFVCDAKTCAVVHEPHHSFYGAGALRDDGSWVYAAVNGPIVGVWEQASEPQFFRLHRSGRLLHLQTLTGKLYMVMEIEGSVHLVLLPASIAASPK
jgi:hypothetical protein